MKLALKQAAAFKVQSQFSEFQHWILLFPCTTVGRKNVRDIKERNLNDLEVN